MSEKEIKVTLIEKFNNLGGKGQYELNVDSETALFMLNSDYVVRSNRSYKIEAKATSEHGDILLFVEGENSHPIDSLFIREAIENK